MVVATRTMGATVSLAAAALTLLVVAVYEEVVFEEKALRRPAA